MELVMTITVRPDGTVDRVEFAATHA
jgi:hypothetical protein